ncbi:MAG: rhodanese-like domain-containing protein [Spirochaetes bacterium]|nr:rhodanese-like domain-containing protein [Spirochaetota bacterium]
MKNKLYTLTSIIGTAAMLFGGAGLSAGEAATIRQIGPNEASELIRSNAGNRNFVILDIRTPGEYREGHIANSVLLDYHSPDFREGLKALDRNRTYFVYCRSGNRTGRAVDIMKDLGFTRIYELRGGIRSWLSSGLTLQVR